MKKILLLLAILPMFMTSCSNDDESTEQTFFVNVYTKWEDSEEKVAKKAFLYIYENMPNGEYILWVTYREEYGGRTYSSYKAISVNHDYRGKSEKKVFQTSMQDQGLYVYQNW